MDPGETPPPAPDPGQRPFEPDELVGDQFANRYQVVRLVASGANTSVFDASDEQTGRLVTLKLIQPRLSASPSFRNRFDLAMRGVAALSHPNIAAVYDWGIARLGDTSTAYVVNEHFTGGSLRDLFDRGRRLTPSQALAVGLDVCRALDHAHRRRFVHTELTPSKIVFGDDRRLRIVDFGLARLLGAATWEQPDAVPTHVAWYAAPEQAEHTEGVELDGTADVYALALVLHEAVTGTVPFKSDSTVASLTARMNKLMPVSADLGPLAAVLERAGRPDAEERSTAAELGKGLLQVASKLPRPEPLPLLSSGLFDTPVDQLRSPDDPTGGVVRPSGQEPAPIVLVPLDEPGDASEIEADEERVPAGEDAVEELPASVGDGDDLVILPLDTELDADDVNGGGTAALETAGSTRDTSVLPVLADTAEPLPRQRRGFPWKVLFGVLVLAALGALGVLATQLFRTPTYLVPDLTGVPEAEARNMIAPNDWQIEVQRERSDEVPVVGQVVRTAPAANVELAEGQPFLMVVSDGPTLRALPDVTGMSVGEAQNALTALALVYTTAEQFSEDVVAGSVISWSVPGDATLTTGSEVLPATSVELVVSSGPEPRTVEDLTGRASVDAQTELESMGLVMTVAEQVFSDTIELGAIVSQDIAPGTQIARGAEVKVVVSKGPDLVVYPDLTGVTIYERAAAILAETGFQPVLTFGDAQGEIQSVSIEGDVPSVGESYRRGTVVEFTALAP